MKILGIEPHPSSKRGGSEKAYFEMLCQLKKNGHQVLLAYCHHEDLVKKYEESGIKTVQIKSTNIQNWRNINSFLDLWQSAKIIIKEKPELIYLNYIENTPIAAIIRIIRGIKSICHIRIPFSGKSRQFILASKFITGFIVLNKKMKSQYNKVLSSPISIVNDSIAGPYDFPLIEKQLAAVCISRISKEKGLLELLATWLILKDKFNIHYPLDIIGPVIHPSHISYKKKLAQFILQNNLNHVRILNPTDKPIETLSNYQFSIMPSICEEAFGRVIPESVLANTVVFARNIGITAEILTPHQKELVYNSEEDLAEKINDFLNGKITIRMDNLKMHILANYSIEKNVGKIEEILSKVYIKT